MSVKDYIRIKIEFVIWCFLYLFLVKVNGSKVKRNLISWGPGIQQQVNLHNRTMENKHCLLKIR